MMKIGVYLGHNPFAGGTFQYCLTILDALEELKQKYNLNVLVIYENYEWDKHLKDYTFQGVQAPRYRFFEFFWRIWRRLTLPVFPCRKLFKIIHPLVKEFLKQNCDTWIFPAQDHWSYAAELNCIATIHDLMHRYEGRFPEVGSRVQFRAREYHYKNICKYAGKILVDSHLGKKQAAESYGEIYREKIFPLHYTIPKIIQRVVPDLNVLESRQIPQDNFIFYPAQFWKHKNHLGLLKAFKEVLREYPSLRLVLVGAQKNGSSEVQDFIEVNKLTDCVHILGHVSDAEIAGLYKLTKCLVMPTFFGPTNIPPLEAKFFGAKVIYSKIYAYNEFLTADESTLFVNPASIQEIRDAIIHILKNSNSISISKQLNQFDNTHFASNLFDIICAFGR